jgi:hypothetical protein
MTILLVLNLSLAAAVGYLIKVLLRPRTNVNDQPIVASNTTPKPEDEPRVVTAAQTNQFNWRQLESEDYRTYIERLTSSLRTSSN